jgi:hypothetical protein
MKGPWFTAGTLVQQLCSNAAADSSESFVHCATNPAVHAFEDVAIDV